MEFPTHLDDALTGGVVSSILLVAIVLLARQLIIRALRRRTETLAETQRQWISIVQNSSVVFIAVGLMFIWSPQLSAFALSITAFALALVILMKEFLLCLLGTLYGVIARPFEIGDWIEIAGRRGEVIAKGMVATDLLELDEGPRRYLYSGRTLSVPNSMLLTQTVRNENFRKRFVHHTFSLTLEPGPEPAALKRIVADTIAHQTEPFDEIAKRYWSMVRRQSGTEIPSHEPSIHMETTEFAKLVLVVTVFCPTEKANDVEEAIAENVMAHVFEHAAKEKASAASGEPATDAK